jgi:hypothetical protein
VSFGEAKRWKKRGVVDYIYLASIWATNNLAGIVIFEKILGLK